MGLLFQPRWSADGFQPLGGVQRREQVVDRQLVFWAALDALARGDGSRFGDLFTEDVAYRGPHVSLDSLAAVQRVLGSPEDSLTDIEIVVLELDAIGDKLIAEWRLDAHFTGPVLFDDRLLIEPTDGDVHLAIASVAEFRGRQIRAIRHYFDDSELMAGVAGVSAHLRWLPDP